MEKAIWISYDLGIKGDYNGLYAWLDDHDATECGDSVAYLKYKFNNDLEEELKKDLEEAVDFNPGDRIYVVRRITKSGRMIIQGSFLFGKRKSNPWEGYGSHIEDIVDGDE